MNINIRISFRLEDVASRLDAIQATLNQLEEGLPIIMKALDDIKAEMDDLTIRATNIENKADAAAAVLTTIGQRLVDEAAVATDLASLQNRMQTLGTDLQARADSLGAAVDAVPSDAASGSTPAA